MNCVLVAVDGAKGSRACVAACARLFADRPPPAVILLHVMQYGGPTAVDGLTIDAELAELRETLEGSPQLEALKAKAEATLATPARFFGNTALATCARRSRLAAPRRRSSAGRRNTGRTSSSSATRVA